MSVEKAVPIAVDQCIEAGILAEFLTEQKAEVVAMSIYQYNEEAIKRECIAMGIIKTARKYGASEQDILAQLMEELDVDETCAREYLNSN